MRLQTLTSNQFYQDDKTHITSSIKTFNAYTDDDDDDDDKEDDNDDRDDDDNDDDDDSGTTTNETNHDDHGGVEYPGPAQHGDGSPQLVLHRQHHVDPLEHEDRRPEEEGQLGRALHLSENSVSVDILYCDMIL